MLYLRKYLVIFIAIASIFIAIGCSSSQNLESAEFENTEAQTTTTTEPFATPVTYQAWSDINASQLEQLMNSNNPPIVLDLRETYYYNNKHMLGAESLPMEYLKEQLDKLDKSKVIVVYDNEDKISRDAAKLLADNGFKQVYNLAGGIVTWTGGVEP